MSSSGWLDRYREGRHAEVWDGLRQLGPAARDAAHREEAQAVCDEMARRARHNVELIVARLTEQGYKFHTNDFGQRPEVPHVAPTARAVEVADWLEARFTDVPLTLLSWLRLVGDVWLVGTHPRWPASAGADPLVLEVEGSRFPGASIEDYFDEEAEAYDEDVEERGVEVAGPFVLPLAPDRLHKDNVSGGDPYGIVLPDPAIDGRFIGEDEVPFVDYLNTVFRHGGFPADSGHPAQAEVTAALAEGMLAL